MRLLDKLKSKIAVMKVKMKRNANTAPNWYQIIDDLVTGSSIETTNITYCRNIKSLQLRRRTCELLEKKLIDHYATEVTSKLLLQIFLKQAKCAVYRFRRHSLFPQRREEQHAYFWLIAYPRLLIFFKKHQTQFKQHEPIFHIVEFFVNEQASIPNKKNYKQRAAKIVHGMIQNSTNTYLNQSSLKPIEVSQYFPLINNRSYFTQESAQSATSELLGSISTLNNRPISELTYFKEVLLSLISAGRFIYYYSTHIITPTPELSSLMIKSNNYIEQSNKALYVLPKYHWEVETRTITSDLTTYLSYIKHKDPDLFLYKKKHVEKVERPTRELIEFDEGLFLPYVFVQQIFSDLLTSGDDTNKRQKRVNMLTLKLESTNNINWKNYYTQLSRSEFLMFAIFSSVLGAIQKGYLKIDSSTTSLLDSLISNISDLSKKSYKNDDIYLKETIINILNFMTNIFLKFNNEYQYGEIGIEAHIFLYVFQLKYKNTRQPNEFQKFELILDETGLLSDKTASQIVIHSYNSKIHRYYNSDIDLIFNPLETINKNLEIIFKTLDNQNADLCLLTPEVAKLIKKTINVVYKKKTLTLVFTGERHHEVLTNIKHRLVDYSLDSTLKINLSIQRFQSLTTELQEFFIETLT